MKYTIELTDNQKKQMDLLCEIAHKHIGFNPKLEPIENLWESELEKHRKQAYNSAINDYNAMYEWLHDCFVDFKEFLLEKGFYTDEKFLDGFVVGQLMYDLICDYDIAEVISEFKKWQEEKKKADEKSIKVGDIVRYKGRQEILVTKVRIDKDSFDGIDENGATYCVQSFVDWDKVGHFDEVEQLLSKLKERE